MEESVQAVPRGELPRSEVMQTPEEVAAKEASFFPEIDIAVLAAAVRSYQALGCWDGVSRFRATYMSRR